MSEQAMCEMLADLAVCVAVAPDAPCASSGIPRSRSSNGSMTCIRCSRRIPDSHCRSRCVAVELRALQPTLPTRVRVSDCVSALCSVTYRAAVCLSARMSDVCSRTLTHCLRCIGSTILLDCASILQLQPRFKRGKHGGRGGRGGASGRGTAGGRGRVVIVEGRDAPRPSAPDATNSDDAPRSVDGSNGVSKRGKDRGRGGRGRGQTARGAGGARAHDGDRTGRAPSADDSGELRQAHVAGHSGDKDSKQQQADQQQQQHAHTNGGSGGSKKRQHYQARVDSSSSSTTENSGAFEGQKEIVHRENRRGGRGGSNRGATRGGAPTQSGASRSSRTSGSEHRASGSGTHAPATSTPEQQASKQAPRPRHRAHKKQDQGAADGTASSSASQQSRQSAPSSQNGTPSASPTSPSSPVIAPTASPADGGTPEASRTLLAPHDRRSPTPPAVPASQSVRASSPSAVVATAPEPASVTTPVKRYSALREETARSKELQTRQLQAVFVPSPSAVAAIQYSRMCAPLRLSLPACSPTNLCPTLQSRPTIITCPACRSTHQRLAFLQDTHQSTY